jgi:Icc-related predicted phosphoesterase
LHEPEGTVCPRGRFVRAHRSEARVSQWFFTSDLHGQGELYEQVMELAAERRPAAVLIGGDLAPHATGAPGIQHQRVFLEGFLVEFARRLGETVPGVELLLLMGNDDWAANHDVLERHHGSLWHSLHARAVEVHGTRVAGSSWVPITPFSIKDWERWEDGEDETPPRLAGWLSSAEGVRDFRFDPDRRSPTIAEALAELDASGSAADTIFVLHSPPRDTACDVISTRQHVGSRAIREFVESRQPRLVLSGHIHESPRVSGAWRDTIGRTPVVNPGQFGTPTVCGVWFDPARPADTLQHTVHR